MSPRKVSRREFLGTSAIVAAGLPIIFGPDYPAFAEQTESSAALHSPRATLNFNLDWRFIREDVSGAEAPAFDDSKWNTVSTPHSFNDVDSFRRAHLAQRRRPRHLQRSRWYRKHFKLPADLSGRKVFLEFEGMRQAGDIFLNGKQVGLYENGDYRIRNRHHRCGALWRTRRTCSR